MGAAFRFVASFPQGFFYISAGDAIKQLVRIFHGCDRVMLYSDSLVTVWIAPKTLEQLLSATPPTTLKFCAPSLLATLPLVRSPQESLQSRLISVSSVSTTYLCSNFSEDCFYCNFVS